MTYHLKEVYLRTEELVAMPEAESRKESQISSSPLKGTDIFSDSALPAGHWPREMQERFGKSLNRKCSGVLAYPRGQAVWGRSHPLKLDTHRSGPSKNEKENIIPQRRSGTQDLNSE